MYIPTIVFKYAYPFDQSRRFLFGVKEFGAYPEVSEVMKRTDEFRQIWSEYNKDGKIIKRMVEMLGVTYPRDIEVYTFGTGMKPMSTPLLIPIIGRTGRNTDDQFMELMVHELLHVIVASEEETPRLKKYWDVVQEKYASEPEVVKNHLIVYAALQVLLIEIFGEAKMRELIKVDDKNYQKAIDIVDEIGPENMIKEFRELTQ